MRRITRLQIRIKQMHQKANEADFFKRYVEIVQQAWKEIEAEQAQKGKAYETN